MGFWAAESIAKSSSLEDSSILLSLLKELGLDKSEEFTELLFFCLEMFVTLGNRKHVVSNMCNYPKK